jgi:AraC-like DNA-binding protein
MNKNIFFFICLTFLMLSIGEAYPEAPHGHGDDAIPLVASLGGRTSLAGAWKICLRDDIQFSRPDYDDSRWDSIDLPDSFMPHVLDKTGKAIGVLWLRKTIAVDQDLPHDDPRLILGRISVADETFFNGEKIGGMGEIGPHEHSQWNYPRHYAVPRAFVRFGAENVIAVRVSYHIYGEMLGTLAIASLEDWTMHRSLTNFFLITAGYIIIAMGVPLFCIFMFIYVLRRQSREYLYYCLQLICGLVIVFDTCTSMNIYGRLLYRYELLGVAWVALNVFHPIFLHRLYDLKRKKIEILLWSFLAIVIFIVVFFNNEEYLRVNGILLIVSTTSIGFYNISCHISALIKKSPYSKVFSFFGITVILGAIHDGFFYLFKFMGCSLNFWGNIFQYPVFHYTASVLYLGTSLILVIRFMTMMREVEELNHNMASFIIKNTELNKRLKQLSESRRSYQYPVVSEKAREKVKDIINYIHENYQYDLSREGLAASIDVHPDNLGRIFKTITNRKLGDYINEMRIQESTKRITETDDTILHIAFSVGFDSLRTFNRAFLKFIGTTPERYRKTHQHVTYLKEMRK